MAGETELTNAILAAANTLLREAGRLFRPHGLTAVQFNVLNLLADEPDGRRASELTAALVVDASSITYVLDRMAALGWVRREQETGDRRAWRVRLTPAGRAMHARVSPLYLTAVRRVAGALKREQIAAMTAALHGMQQAAPGVADALLAEPLAGARKRRTRS